MKNIDGDAYKFTDSNNDQWLGVVCVCPTNKRLMVKDINNIYYSLGITRTSNTRISFSKPIYLGNILKDKELAKRLNIKFMKP